MFGEKGELRPDSWKPDLDACHHQLAWAAPRPCSQVRVIPAVWLTETDKTAPPLFRDRLSSKGDRVCASPEDTMGPERWSYPSCRKNRCSGTQGPHIRIKVLSLKLNASWWWGAEMTSGVQHSALATAQERGRPEFKSTALVTSQSKWPLAVSHLWKWRQ